MRRVLAVLALFAFVAAPRAQQPVTVQQYLDVWQQASNVPGVAVGIVLKDGTVISAAAGESDRESHRKMQPTDLMLAGSTGKTFFAAVALQLIEEGKLDLNAPISKYLGSRPWFSRLPNAKDVTVRHLMTHTSGIIRYEFDDKFIKDLRANPGKVWTPEEELAYLFDTAAPFAAGQGWDYSDTNYIVLGLIVEDLLGVGRGLNVGPGFSPGTYYAEIDKRFLKPIGLKGVVPSTSRRIPGLVQGYAGANDPLGLGGAVIKDGEFVVNPQFEWAGGGFATSAVDLARWGHELYSPNGKALSAKARAMMIDAAVPARLGAGSKYGLGVIIRPPDVGRGFSPGSTTWGHSGFFPGYLSELIYVVDTGVTLAIQINTSGQRSQGSASPLRVLYALAELLGNAK
ncbi:MAG: class A beta-lactamase-related serine hydrolase [Acidobacteria bacterium]|nr:MAG: class A beta-lactamase-related serine hydrolase [Acidobacteriota bacterium]